MRRMCRKDVFVGAAGLFLSTVAAGLTLGSATSARAAEAPPVLSHGERLGIDTVDTGGVFAPPVTRPKHRVLYVNRSGGTFVAATEDDSTSNASTIVDNGSKVVPAFDWGDGDWAEVIGCVRAKYAAYAIDVVDVEPEGDRAYIEAVVGGTQDDIGYTSDNGYVLGVASTTGCRIVEKGVSYSFSAAHARGDTRGLCGTILQESAHQFGMEHAMNADDAMTYLPPSPSWPIFSDVEADCGEFSPMPCRCGGSTQNSHQWLLAVLGPSDTVPPTITLDTPADGASLRAPFPVEATASDNVRIDRVELVIDGVVVTTKDDPPYNFEVPTGTRSGARTIAVRAVDGDENATEASISVNVEAECTNDDECGEGQSCDGDVCLGGVGADCDVPGQCAGGICFVDVANDDQFCTQECSPDSDECPGGSSCVQPEFGTPKCLPGGDGGGGGCQAGGRASGGAAGLVLVIGVGMLVATRRRRRRA